MTTRKSGLLGLVLGMAFLAACEPKSEVIVEPAPQDTTPTISLNLVPDTATINVAGTVTLVPVVTGTTNQAVTFSSSNTSIATVNASGVVTGVAAGRAVITAVSTADPRARDASVINVIVPPTPPSPIAPSINIGSITQGGTQFPVNTANVAGQIDVTVNADIPVGSNVQRLEVMVVNSAGAEVEACRQTFTGTGEISVNAVPVDIVCSINTADFDPVTGAPRFPNGQYQIRARLIGATGTAVATATSQPLTFNNASFISLRAIEASFFNAGTTTAKACVNAGSDPRSIAGPGSRWCGGDLVINLTPVIFGTVGGTIANDRVASVTVSLTTSGVGVNGMSNCDNRNTALNSGAIAPEDQQRVQGTSAEFAATGAVGMAPGSTVGGVAGVTALEGGAARNPIGYTSMGLTITDADGDGFQDFPGCPSITLTAQDTNPADGLSVTFSAENEPDCDVIGTCSGTTGALARPGLFDVEDRIAITVNSTTVGGQAGPVCINPDPRLNPLPTAVTFGGCGTGFGGGSAANAAFFANPINIDNSGPRIVEFDLTPTGCQTGGTSGGCFVNGAFAFAPRAGFFQSVDYGSDSQNANTTFVAGTSLSALSTVRTGLDLAPGSVTANDLFLRVTVRDALGNTSGNRFLASCGAAPCFSGNTTTSTNTGNQFRFGVDIQNPEFDFTASAFPPNGGANDGTTYNLAFRDVGIGPSGFQSVTFDPVNFPASVSVTGPVWAKMEFINPNGTFCLNPETGNVLAGGGNSGCAGGPEGNGFMPTDGSFNVGNFLQGDGYYRLTFFLQDAAGNRTAPLTWLTLIDRSAPNVGGIATPSTITGNAAARFTADATDNRDLGDVILYTTYPGAGPGGLVPDFHIQEAAVAIPGAAYGPPLNTTGTADVTVPNFIRSIQRGVAGAHRRATSVTFLVRDQAGVVDGDICPLPAAANDAATVATVPNPPVGAGAIGNCRLRRDDITNAINAGITATGTFAETNVPGITDFTVTHNATTPLCNQTTQTGGPATQPCPANPTSATFTASAVGPSATFANPFVRVNFYYTDLTTGRSVLFATATAPTVTDQCPAGATCPPTATVRTYTWTGTFIPNQFQPGTYVVSAIGVRANGQGLLANNVIDVAID